MPINIIFECDMCGLAEEGDMLDFRMEGVLPDGWSFCEDDNELLMCGDCADMGRDEQEDEGDEDDEDDEDGEE